MFLCFLAGFGFEYACLNRFSDAKKSFRWVMTAFAVIFAVLSFYLLYLACHLALIQKIPGEFDKIGLALFSKPFESSQFLTDHFFQSSFYAFEAALILLALGWLGHEKWRSLLIAFVLIFHMLDLYSYKISEYYIRTMPLTGQEQALFSEFSISLFFAA